MKGDYLSFAPSEPGDQHKGPKKESFYSKVLREQSGESVDGPDEVQIFDDLPKSPIDEREYRGVILQNGLRVMLISDPSIHLSAACLDVACGSWSDPPELPGLAHYLEHLLLMGTEKYPDPSDFFNFINKHGGEKNASTWWRDTNYYFTVDSAHLEPALDRLAQFFIAPLFDAKYMEKELNAIQSEFDLKFDSDEWINYRVNMETCDQTHQFAKFSTGNKKTLKENPEANGIDVRASVLQFYSQHYSANTMCLCVLGKASLDELYAMIVERLPFDQIKNKKITPMMRSSSLEKIKFRKKHLQKEIRILPKKDINQLLVEFHPFELLESLRLEDRWYTMETATDYLQSLFDQKHDGSIQTELKDRLDLVSSVYSYGGGCALNVAADLHANDVMNSEKIDEIVKAVFQFIKFAKSDGIQKWIHEEKKTITEIALNNKEKEDPLSTVKNISYKMQIYKIDHVVESAASFDREFRPELIGQLIDHLTPENMRITLISKAFKGQTNRKEKYYGIRYSCKDIAQERVACWTNVDFNENLTLHSPNEYIPTDLKLVDREKEEHQVPQRIKHDDLANLWFLQENKLKTPRAFYGIYLKSQLPRSDPAARILMEFYELLVEESLEEDSRLASEAGIDFSISATENGLIIEVHGYSAKLHIVLAKIMDALVEFEPSRERFEKLKKQRVREYKDVYKKPLDSLVHECFELLLTTKNSVEQQLDCMDRVSFEELQSIPRRLFSRMFINLFVHGNVTRADAELVENLVKKRLINVYGTSPVSEESFTIDWPLKLDDNSFYLYHQTSEEHHQNAILSSFQIGPNFIEAIAKVDLLVHVLKEHFFAKLRTEEQLGYYVSMEAYTIQKVLSVNFLIQSSYSVQHLDERIQQFVWWAGDHLASLTDEEFATHKESLRLNWSKPKTHQKLVRQSSDFWAHIKDVIDYSATNYDDRDYDRELEQKLRAVKMTSKEDIIRFFNEHLIENTRELSIRITGTKTIVEEDSEDEESENEESEEEESETEEGEEEYSEEEYSEIEVSETEWIETEERGRR